MKLNYYLTVNLAPNIIEIDDICMTKMFLVIGEDKAVLIDCGIGLGNVYEYVRTLTDKPLSVIITHGHLDHAMGSGSFPDDVPVYMSPLDDYIYPEHTALDKRMGYFHGNKLFSLGLKGLFIKDDNLDWITPASLDRFLPLNVGDTFDLGNEVLRICPGAGHTKGCITVLFEKARILLLGDAINGGTFLFDDYSLPVSELKKTLMQLKEETDGKYDKALFCHGMNGKPGFGDVNTVNGGIWLCDAILEGRDKKIKTKRMGKDCYMTKKFMSKEDIGDGSTCNIIYSDFTNQ